MKIVVNSGRTAHRAVKPGVQIGDDKFSKPVVKAYGPTHLLDVPDEEAKFLIARGFARKYEPPRQPDADPPAKDPPAK